MVPALLFVISGLVILMAATRLTRHADTIADETGLGRVWIGTILLAGATSLPELATDVVAVRIGAPDLAAGDLFGSSMANMLILAILDLLPPRRGVLQRAAVDHALSASLAITLTGLAGIFVLAGSQWGVLGVGPESVLLLAVFVAGTRVVYRHKRAEEPTAPAGPSDVLGPTQRPALRSAIASFSIAAAVVLVASPVFAHSAKEIAEITGMGHAFMGTWLVGLSTSLPEVVSSVAAVRMGAFDLAVGNLFGSNAFNMTIFFAMDLAHPGGSIFGALAKDHALSALCAIVLMALGLGAIVFRSEKRWAGIEPDSMLMIATYLGAILLLYAKAAHGS